MNQNKILNNINMENSKKKEKDIDFELDLTSDNQIYYVSKTENENNFDKNEIHFINKLIDFGFFLSGFVIMYTILKIKVSYKKIKLQEKSDIQKLYYKKIYKKKMNFGEIQEL